MNVAGLINILIMLLLMNDLILDLQMVLWRKFQKLQIYDLELYYWRDPRESWKWPRKCLRSKYANDAYY